LSCVIYENVDVIFIEIYHIHLSILKVIFFKSNPFRFKETFYSIKNKNGAIGRGTQSCTDGAMGNVDESYF